MATNKVDFSKKAIVVVTGASRGIGRTISVEVARNLNQNSIIVLLARSEPGLLQTKSLIQEIDKSITVFVHPVDLGSADSKTFEGILENVVSLSDVAGIEFGVIFHNAGSTGTLQQTTDLSDTAQWRNYFDLNLISVAALNAVFIKKIRLAAPQIVVVNITSLCGRIPFQNLAMYGAGKAARELLFKVLALEEPNIVVLNYSPGPVDTDMVDGVIRNAQSDEVKSSFRKIKESTILTTEQTVEKLLQILDKGDFASGDVIDYYDRV